MGAQTVINQRPGQEFILGPGAAGEKFLVQGGQGGKGAFVAIAPAQIFQHRGQG
jgi:hypothetical protein